MAQYKAITEMENKGKSAVINASNAARNPFSAEGKTAIANMAFDELRKDRKRMELEL